MNTEFFGHLKIDDTFKIISKAQRPIDNDLIMVYKKTSKSQAVCIDQIGYNSSGCVKGTFTFSVNKKVTI